MKEKWVERTLMGVVALLLLMLNALMVEKYDAVFSVLADDYAKRLSYLFHVSGFDPNSYAILTEWGMRYDVLRHPLLPYLMALPASVNGVVVSLFGINAALYISALMSWACGLVSALLLYRLLRRIVGAAAEDAALLTLLFFSFAYIQVTCFVPDHFGLSLCLILLSLYLIGRAAKAGRVLKAWQTVLLFVLTAGVTLTNGLKVLAAEWVARGRRFFLWRFFLLAVVVPSALMLGAGLVEERIYVYPKQQAQQRYFEEHRAEVLAKARRDHQRYKHAPWVIHKGRPLGQGGLLRWTDVSTSRWDTLTENLWGESIQLHERYVLDDVLTSYRPVLLAYQSPWRYAVSLLMLLLFVAGIWAGRGQRLLWMCLLGIVPDAVMHLGLGFAINEVYIMAAHWLYVVPVALSFLFLRLRGWQLATLRLVVLSLTMYLLCHNLGLIVGWMQQPLVSTAFWYE